MVPEREKYYLNGHIEVTDWYGQHAYKRLVIETDERGLEEIRKDPLQDFISFGVQSVDYAEFVVYKEVVREDEKAIYTTCYKDPVGNIEAGKSLLNEEEVKCLQDSWHQELPETVCYHATEEK